MVSGCSRRSGQAPPSDPTRATESYMVVTVASPSKELTKRTSSPP